MRGINHIFGSKTLSGLGPNARIEMRFNLRWGITYDKLTGSGLFRVDRADRPLTGRTEGNQDPEVRCEAGTSSSRLSDSACQCLNPVAGRLAEGDEFPQSGR